MLMVDLKPVTDSGTGAEGDSPGMPSDPPPHLRNPLIGWISATLQGADYRGPPGGGSDVTSQSLTASHVRLRSRLLVPRVNLFTRFLLQML